MPAKEDIDMPSKWFFKIKAFTCFAILGSVLSCVPGPIVVSTEDVTMEEKLWYGYKKLETYTLQEDVFIRIVDLPLPNRYILVAPREKTAGLFTLHFRSPASISEYEKNKNNWNDIKGIVKAGTRLKCTRLIRYKPLGYPDSLYIYAEIIDGPLTGQEIEISELSLPGPEDDAGFLLRPNPNLLR